MSLSVLLAQALVAHTIELDNEFEHRMPHRTTVDRGTTKQHGPWLTSYVMWANCVRPLGEQDGLRVAELTARVGTETNLAGMRRWGYVTTEPAPGDQRARPPERDLIVRLTRAGRRADEVWRALPALIEQRWQDRFGGVPELKAALTDLVRGLDVGLPDCLPVLGYGLFTRVARVPVRPADGLSLIALLSRATVAFGLAYEADTTVSLAIAANVLRVLDERGVPMRELPRRCGVAGEGVAMATGFLARKDMIAVESDGRTRIVRLTEQGSAAKAAYRRRVTQVEAEWTARLGDDIVARVATALPRGDGELHGGPVPRPDGWRARVRRPDTLPYYPMVLHRGGYPDGS